MHQPSNGLDQIQLQVQTKYNATMNCTCNNNDSMHIKQEPDPLQSGNNKYTDQTMYMYTNAKATTKSTVTKYTKCKLRFIMNK